MFFNVSFVFILPLVERGRLLFLWRNLSGILIDNESCSQFSSLVNLELQYLSSKNCEITETLLIFIALLQLLSAWILVFHTAYAQLGTAKYLEGKLHMEYCLISLRLAFQEPRAVSFQILGALIALHFVQRSTAFNQLNFRVAHPK